MKIKEYSLETLNSIIEMAWADEVSFEDIRRQHNISESEVIHLMRRNIKSGSFKVWRKRVSGRNLKHERRAKLKLDFINSEFAYNHA